MMPLGSDTWRFHHRDSRDGPSYIGIDTPLFIPHQRDAPRAAKGVGGAYITYSTGNRGYSISRYLFPGRGVGLGWCRVRCSRRTLVPCRSATYCLMLGRARGPAEDPDVGAVEPLR